MASTRFSRGSMSAYSAATCAEDLEKEPVRVLHDVRLRHAVDGAAALRARVFEGEADDALGRLRAQIVLIEMPDFAFGCFGCSLPRVSISSCAASLPDSNSMPA